MRTGKRKKQSLIVVEELGKRSRKGLELAKKAILAEEIEHEKVREALKHYVSYWNDFTHPGFFSIACEAVGGDPDTMAQVQAALALMAAAFDIHDDILDGSGSKHGVTTVFGRFGMDIALLLGNAFIVRGFVLLSQSVNELRTKKRTEVFDALNSALFELGNGHALELDLKNRTGAEAEEYMQVVRMKAASIEADMRIGALVGGGTDREVEVLSRYGRVLGILATLREEYIDMFEIEELTQRVRDGNLPIPIVYAMRDAGSKAAIVKLLGKRKLSSRDVDVLLDVVFEAKSVKSLRKEMEDLISESIQLVGKVENEATRNMLLNLTTAGLEDL